MPIIPRLRLKQIKGARRASHPNEQFLVLRSNARNPPGGGLRWGYDTASLHVHDRKNADKTGKMQ